MVDRDCRPRMGKALRPCINRALMDQEITPEPPAWLETDRGYRLAYHRLAGAADQPGVMFLGGYRSDMQGSKALALEAHCRDSGQAFLRFDYSGHGDSEGAFTDGTISRWLADAVDVFDRLTTGPQILIGSSMGGWIAMLLALARPERVQGLIGIAAAPDFTEDLMWARFSEAERERLMREGVLYQETPYDPEPYAITRALIEDGRRHLLLRGPIAIDAPVHLLQGMQDADVPWRHVLRITEALVRDDVTVTLFKSGDHRLSEPARIRSIRAALVDLTKDL